MTVPHTVDAIVIGGGATGAGVLRDLARRGLRTLLVERGDFGTGTTGRYHGLLHSGGRYVGRDKVAARECIVENRVLRRIAPASIEDTGGYFVATPDDPDDYVEAFADNCEQSGVAVRGGAGRGAARPRARAQPADPARVPRPGRVHRAVAADRRHASPTPGPRLRRAARTRRSSGSRSTRGRIVAVTLRDERSGTVSRVWTQFVVSAAGAWAGQIAALAGVQVEMTPGKGTMLIYNHRMTDAVINRCHKSSDGDIMVPVHTVAILGTTDIKVPDPDDLDIPREEVAGAGRRGREAVPRPAAAAHPARLRRRPAAVQAAPRPAAGGATARSPGPTRSSTTPTRASTTSSRSWAASSRPTG